jgi:hypothetical protein
MAVEKKSFAGRIGISAPERGEYEGITTRFS